MAKHISNKIITCNEKDSPWITPEIKTEIRRNSRVYRKWVNRGRNPQDKVREVRNSTNKLIKEVKLAYYTNLGNKLSDPEIGQKQFWNAYKKLLIRKGIPIYHQLLKMALISLIVNLKLIYLINILHINAL